MGKVERFEDFDIWKKARIIVNDIYDITSANYFNRDYSLKDQIRRAAISIMLNIAEGYARKTNKEFVQFLIYAHGSVSEIQSALYIALDRKYISDKNFSDLYNKCSEESKMTMGLIKYLKS